MNFWDRVLYLMEIKEINRKTLAQKVGIDESSISKGRKYGTYPYANTAVKIAKLLDTNVEYLVTGKISSLSDKENLEYELFYKYSNTINNLNTLPPNIRKNIEDLILEIAESEK